MRYSSLPDAARENKNHLPGCIAFIRQAEVHAGHVSARMVALFRDRPGYRYLGDSTDREGEQ